MYFILTNKKHRKNRENTILFFSENENSREYKNKNVSNSNNGLTKKKHEIKKIDRQTYLNFLSQVNLKEASN